MYAEHFSTNLIFALFCALASAIPSSAAASLTPRGFGEYAPATKARTAFDRHAFPPGTLAPRRTFTVTWWAPGGSQTHVMITTAQSMVGGVVMDLLNDACTNIIDRIEDLGDGTISGGSWAYNRVSLSLRARNANNHQTTWGVLSAAIDALMDYMGRSGFEGACTFVIYDGMHEVGTGALEARNAAGASR